MLLYMVRNPSGCLIDAGVALMLPLDGPLLFTENLIDLFCMCPGQLQDR